MWRQRCSLLMKPWRAGTNLTLLPRLPPQLPEPSPEPPALARPQPLSRGSGEVLATGQCPGQTCPCRHSTRDSDREPQRSWSPHSSWISLLFPTVPDPALWPLTMVCVAMWDPGPVQGKGETRSSAGRRCCPFPTPLHRDSPCSMGTLPHPMGSARPGPLPAQSLRPTSCTPGSEG